MSQTTKGLNIDQDRQPTIEIPDRVNITKNQIADFCEKNHILRLAFFGSVLGNDYRPDSDVDILVYLDCVFRQD